MSATPMFARYVKRGDRIQRPGWPEFYGVESVRWYDPKVSNRPHGVVSGWLLSDDGTRRYGFSYPADQLVLTLR